MVGCHTHLHQVRQGEHCHTHFSLDATSDIMFLLVSSFTAHNTIAAPDSPLIYSTSRHHPYVFPAISYTWKRGTLGKNDWVVRTVFPTGQVGQAAAKPSLAYSNSLGPKLASAKKILPHVLHTYLPVWSSNTTSPYPSYPSCIHIMF